MPKSAEDRSLQCRFSGNEPTRKARVKSNAQMFKTYFALNSFTILSQDHHKIKYFFTLKIQTLTVLKKYV